MKRLCLLSICLFGFYWMLLAQEHPAEAEYRQQDSLLQEWWNRRQEESYRYLEQHPDQLDSIRERTDEDLRELLRQTIALATRYASTSGGMERLFAVRQYVPKDTLTRILLSVNPEMQASFHGKTLKAYVETRQIQPGDTLFRFPCTQTDGKAFDWGITQDKQILLIYGGLGCMGEEGRRELKRLQSQISEKDFLLLIYYPCRSLEELKQWEERYPFNAVFISDFKENDSPMKIKYDAQATPTCFLTDRKHRLQVRCTGLDTQQLNPHILR